MVLFSTSFFFLGVHCFYHVPCDVLLCDQILKKNLSNDQRTSKNHVIRHRAQKIDEKKAPPYLLYM